MYNGEGKNEGQGFIETQYPDGAVPFYDMLAEWRDKGDFERQTAFGYGVHFCLGYHLARMELRSLFGHLIPRLAALEVTGPAPASKTPFVGGLKSLPIRYQLKPVSCWAA